MLVNQKLVSTNKNQEEWLVVDVDDYREEVVVTDMLANPPRRPKAKPFSWVLKKLKEKTFQLIDHEHPDELFTQDSELKSGWIKIRNEAYETITSLVDDGLTLDEYFYGDSAGILKRLIKESGRSKKFVQASINRYFRYGSMSNSLLPRYFVCGKNYQVLPRPVVKRNGKVCLKSKPGPETKYGTPYRAVTELDQGNIKTFSNQLKDIKTVNLTDLYRDFCREYFVRLIKPDGVDESDIAEDFYAVLPRTHLISPRSFKRELKKCIGTLEFIRKRTGSILYDRDHKGKPGVARKGLRGPTSRYEIDSTVADCYIRYEYTKDERLSVGRPVIYMVIDVVSSMIVGLHVCFHGPDWHGESQALFNAFTDKVEFCKKYGVFIKIEDWPCFHVSRELTLDRGTENGHRSTTSLLKGKIGLTAANFNAYHRGDAKGTVEKVFDTIQLSAIPDHTGKVYKVPRKEDQHPSRGAVYTYSEFMNRLIKSILLRNNNAARIQSHNFEMCRDGIGQTPRDIWNWGLAEAIIPPRQKSIDHLRFALLPQGKASVTAQGIKFHGLFYNSDEVNELKWLDLAKNDGRFPLEVRYSDVNTSKIWCRNPETKKVMTLDITDRSEAYKDQLWTQVLSHIEEVKSSLARLDEKRFTSHVLMDMDLAEMDKSIVEATKHLTTSTSKGIELGLKERKEQMGNVQKHTDFEEIANALDLAAMVTEKDYASANDNDDLRDPTYKKLAI
jgi:putative transposase